MRHLYILFICSFFVINSSHGQKQFAPLNAIWKYEGFSHDCQGYHQQYIVTADTTIDGKDCSLIKAFLWDDSRLLWSPHGELIVYEHQGKVDFLQDSTFFQLYDFNANVGDTVVSYDPNDKGLFSVYTRDPYLPPQLLPYVVIDTGRVSVGNASLRTWKTDVLFDSIENCSRKNTIIERIGTTAQYFTREDCWYIGEGCYGGFICYSDSVLDYAMNSTTCDTFTHANETEDYVFEIEANPNPATNQITIENSSPEHIKDLKLVGINSLEYQLSIENNRIALANFSPGIYFLIVTNHDLSIGHMKLVIQ